MATAKSPKKRSQRSTRLSRQTRSAHELAQILLSQLQENAELAGLQENAEVQPLVARLRQDVETLIGAPKLRIGAARRLQGAASRRQTTAQQLFAACAEIRRRIKVRFRGPTYAELRRAFCEGLPANHAKPETVLSFADQVLTAAKDHGEALRTVRVGPPTLRRLTHMLTILRKGRPERSALRGARRQVTEELGTVATRVQETCGALLAAAGHTLGEDAIGVVKLRDALARKPGRRRSA